MKVTVFDDSFLCCIEYIYNDGTVDIRKSNQKGEVVNSTLSISEIVDIERVICSNSIITIDDNSDHVDGKSIIKGD